MHEDDFPPIGPGALLSMALSSLNFISELHSSLTSIRWSRGAMIGPYWYSKPIVPRSRSTNGEPESPITAIVLCYHVSWALLQNSTLVKGHRERLTGARTGSCIPYGINLCITFGLTGY